VVDLLKVELEPRVTKHLGGLNGVDHDALERGPRPIFRFFAPSVGVGRPIERLEREVSIIFKFDNKVTLIFESLCPFHGDTQGSRAGVENDRAVVHRGFHQFGHFFYLIGFVSRVHPGLTFTPATK